MMGEEVMRKSEFLRSFKVLLPAICGLSLAAASPSFAGDDEKTAGNTGTSDPLESLNRITSGFNALFRQAILDPVVDVYQLVTPDPVEEIISNAASNLSEPITIGSSLLQGDTENAGVATQRFLINSTVGVAGLGDPATDMGLEQRREDLGQAFGANGVEPGPHIVLPILGPSNLRDAAGDILTGIASPLPLAGKIAGGAVEYSVKQDAINAIGDNALDRYVAEREAYEQNRDYKIKNGEAEGLIFEDDKPVKK
jgi:phospholipid-binding lipoprotein MlaA